MPVLATLPARPHLVPSPHEVERVFDVSLAELADPAIFHEERWRIPGRHDPGHRRQLVRRVVLRGLGRDDLGRHGRMIHELLSIVLTGTNGSERRARRR